MRTPFGPGVTILGSLALIMILFLLIGLLLPGTWEAKASVRIPASPEVTYLYLDSPADWKQWTTWPETGVKMVGNPSGEGSGFTWDDPELGNGAFTIIEAQEPAYYNIEVHPHFEKRYGIFFSVMGGGYTPIFQNLRRNP